MAGTADQVKASAEQHDGWEVFRDAASEIPAAAGELAKEAWEHPGKTLRHTVNVVGSAAVMGAAFGYIVPAGGPASWLIATGLTAPWIYHGYKTLSNAGDKAAEPGADVHAIAHELAKNTVSGTADFGLTFLSAGFGAQGGHRLASTEGRMGLAAESSQGFVLNAENKGLAAIARASKALMPEAPAAVARFGEHPTGIVGVESAVQRTALKLNPEEMTGPLRTFGIINRRLDQYLGTAEDRELYFGTLHGHSKYSDGLGDPKVLFAKAEADGAQFTAITDHNHLAARDGIKPGDPRMDEHKGVPTVAESPIEYAQTFADAAAATKPGKFVALVGTEMGTIGKVGGHHGGANHINLFEVPTFFEAIRQPRGGIASFLRLFGIKSEPVVTVPDIIKYNNEDIAAMIKHLDLLKDTTGKRPIIQLNHPRYTADYNPALEADVRGRDYGVKSFKSKAEWREKFGKYASQIEVIKGEALNPDPITEVKPGDLDPTSYMGYLNEGLHVSPTFGRDFHFGEPVANPAGTGIYATALTKDALLDALRERRTIATTSTQKLTGVMSTAEGHAMGTVLDRAAVQDLSFNVKIGGEIAPDAQYKVLLWGDRKIGDGKLAEVAQSQEMSGQDLLAGNGLVAFDKVKMPLKNKTAHFIEVQRKEVDATHTDRMWTAPIWVEPLSGTAHSFWLRGLVGSGNQLIPGVFGS